MNEVKVLGVDLAKTVFQVHGVDEHGRTCLRKRLQRDKLLEFIAQLRPCLIGMEACGGSNYWAREFRQFGHAVRQIAPQFVVPFRRSEKNDRNDAEAICEAIQRPNMRFVPLKETKHQQVQSLHRVRTRLVGNRTALSNEIRGLLMEWGITIPQKVCYLKRYFSTFSEERKLSDEMKVILSRLYSEFKNNEDEISFYDRKINEVFRREPLCKRIAQVEGVGRITATAIFYAVPEPDAFKNGRQFSASLGLVPKQNSSGNIQRLSSITKKGDIYLRTLLVHGGRAFVVAARKRKDKKSRWAFEKSQTKGINVAAVAVAAKNARTIWAMLKHNADYEMAA